MPACGWDGLIIDDGCLPFDVQAEAGWIVGGDGLLADGPAGGDLIEQDWTAGAIWQPGPKRTYTFEVPLLLRGPTPDKAVAQLQALQAFVGRQVTLRRRLTVDGMPCEDTCEAVMASAVQVVWPSSQAGRGGHRAVCTFQNLSGTWTRVSP